MGEVIPISDFKRGSWQEIMFLQTKLDVANQEIERLKNEISALLRENAELKANQKAKRRVLTAEEKAAKANPLRPRRKGEEPSVPKAHKAEPFHSPEDYKKMKNYFLEREKYRDNLLLAFGCTSALRISDILKLKIGDVVDEAGKIRNYVPRFTEKKTTKLNDGVAISNGVVDAIELYLASLKSYDRSDYLFRSRKKNGEGKYVITEIHAYRILNEAAKAIGLEYHISTHTLRKTWASFAYSIDPTKISVIQAALGHANEIMTHKYIGQMQKERDDFTETIDAILNA